MSSSLLKQLVTGEDACTGGAGPSRNAVGALGDALFGGSSRVTERTGRTDGASTSRAPADVLRERAMNHVGVLNGGNDFVDEFLSRSKNPIELPIDHPSAVGVAGPRNDTQLLFEQVYSQQQRRLEQTAHYNHDHDHEYEYDHSVESACHGFLHQRPNSSLMPPRPLSVKEQCQVRDRSTILARQLFSDRGDAFVNQHVEGLLRSLHVDARSLPREAERHGQQQWEGLWNKTAVAMDHAAGVSSLGMRAPASWADEFVEADKPTGDKHVSWADEFEQQQGENLAGVDKDPAINSVSAIEHTRRLADSLSAETDPKFKQSQFLQFVSKMSRGELVVDEQMNGVREVDPETARANAAIGSMRSKQSMQSAPAQPPATSMSYVDEYLDTKAGGRDWVEEFATEVVGGLGVPNTTTQSWVQDFIDQAEGGAWSNPSNDWTDEFAAFGNEGGFSSAGGYKMASNNPFLTDTDSFSKGRQLFQQGLLTESVLAIEAECTRRPGNVDAWTLLGKVNAENDDDVQAIEAMKRGLLIDPNNLELLLSLGVAYTNEFDRRNALEYLRSWLATNPRYSLLMRDATLPPDSSQEVSHAIHLYKTAAHQCPDDADVHAALGVLCNLARQYDDAVLAFRQALAVNGNDSYGLWNKLGATLANSGRSGEALDAYRRALEAKPNYMRGWINMGISLANLGNYEESSRYYVRALSLNGNSSSVWGYLRTSLICAGREDLLHAVDENNVERLRQALPL